MERSKMMSAVEVNKLEAGVNDASRSLHQFCLGKPHTVTSSQTLAPYCVSLPRQP